MALNKTIILTDKPIIKRNQNPEAGKKVKPSQPKIIS